MRNFPSCFICKQRVLGLRGQDLNLDTFYLQGQHADLQVIAENAFGECHMLCLLGSKWGSFWAERIAENMRHVRRFESLIESEQFQMLRNARMTETIIIRTDGWIKFVSDRRLHEARKTTEGLLLPVREEMSVELSDDMALIADLERTLASNRPFSLWEFVSKLGLANRLLYPEAIRPGEIYPVQGPTVPAKPLKRWQGDTFLIAAFSYDEFVPGDFVEPLLQFRRGM
jgi:hypothetical protein